MLRLISRLTRQTYQQNALILYTPLLTRSITSTSDRKLNKPIPKQSIDQVSKQSVSRSQSIKKQSEQSTKQSIKQEDKSDTSKQPDKQSNKSNKSDQSNKESNKQSTNQSSSSNKPANKSSSKKVSSKQSIASTSKSSVKSSIKQSIKQSSKQSIKQSIMSESTTTPTKIPKKTGPLMIKRAAVKPASAISQSINQSGGSSTNQSSKQSSANGTSTKETPADSQSSTQSTSQFTSQSNNQSNNQSTTQPKKPAVKSESSSDEDEDDSKSLASFVKVPAAQTSKPAAKPIAKPVAKPAPKPVSAPVKKLNEDRMLDSDDDEEEWTGAASVTRERTGPAAAPSAKQSIKQSDDEDENDFENDENEQSNNDEEDEEEEEEDEDEDDKPKKKKAAKRRAPKKAAKKSPAKKRRKKNDDKYKDNSDDESEDDNSDAPGSDEEPNVGTLHDPSEYTVRAEVSALVELHGANKWWKRDKHEGNKKWETLEHNGVLFPPEYEPHNIPLVYDGEEIPLEADAEEIASMYATMLETAPTFTSSETFNKNFFRDFCAALPSDSKIQDFEKCDFTDMREFLTKQREDKKAAKKANPTLAKAEKAEKDKLVNIYGYALVDGFKEKVANFNVEPPGLFRGRGAHPKTGSLKRRVRPEDVTINVGLGVPIPPAPPGHRWKGICHNNTTTWLAFWLDNVNGAYKYVWLAASSKFKGQSDIAKYTKAQNLKKCIHKIRETYRREMVAKEMAVRQKATAIYLIDFLALRVGNEKDTSEVADTVGCCSLRVEHLSFTEPSTVTFDFLGKDSMQYLNTVELDPAAFKNLKDFCRRKTPNEDVFDTLNVAALNQHLKNQMPGLTAKVFRTYNASYTLQRELFENPENDIPADSLVTKKVLEYTKCNRVVAILCNHQRSIPKGHALQMSKLEDRLSELRDEREEIEDAIEALTSKSKAVKTERAERAELRDERAEERFVRREIELQDAVTRGIASAPAALEKLRANKEKRPEESKKVLALSSERLESKLAAVTLKIENLEHGMSAREETKTIALGTSKINYMDPRITVAWCKAKDVPIEKIFNRSLLAKFPWALEVPSTWRF